MRTFPNRANRHTLLAALIFCALTHIASNAYAASPHFPIRLAAHGTTSVSSPAVKLLRSMVPSVVAAGHQLQVLDSIVERVFVDMMDDLRAEQRVGHHHSVFGDVSILRRSIRSGPNGVIMISKKAFLVTADGKAVEAGPTVSGRVLVGANCEISEADMKKYGLSATDLGIDGDAPPVESKPAVASDFHALSQPQPIAPAVSGIVKAEAPEVELGSVKPKKK